MDSPPDPPSETSGKTSDAATFVTDLLQKYDVKEYIGTVQSDESSITKERSDDVDIYSLSVLEVMSKKRKRSPVCVNINCHK